MKKREKVLTLTVVIKTNHKVMGSFMTSVMIRSTRYECLPLVLLLLHGKDGVSVIVVEVVERFSLHSKCGALVTRRRGNLVNGGGMCVVFCLCSER